MSRNVDQQTGAISQLRRQKAKLANVERGEYSTPFAHSLIHKDLRLALEEADAAAVPMPTMAAAQQLYTAAIANGLEASFSVMIRLMEALASVPAVAETPGAP